MEVTVASTRLSHVYLRDKVTEALVEDLGDPPNDPTTESIIPAQMCAEALLVARTDGVVAGMFAVVEVFRQLDPRIALEPLVEDGRPVAGGQSLARLQGPLRGLLMGERTALNFLQRLSGIASLTATYVEAVGGTRAMILDTRKTSPGQRPLERYAVAAGGGVNHRYNLAAAVLIKDNHVLAAGGVAEALRRARATDLPVQLEVDTLDQLDQALEVGADRILLDNFAPALVAEAVLRVAGRAELEVSGGVSLGNIRDYALTGVDRIAVGALTHSVRALDISMEVVRTWPQ